MSEIESTLIAPDITTDMYNDYYDTISAEFLSSLNKTPEKEIIELQKELSKLSEDELLPCQVDASASEVTGSWKMQPGGLDMSSSYSPVKDTRVSLPVPTPSSSFKYTRYSQPETCSSSEPVSKFKTPHHPSSSSNSEPIQSSHQPNTFTDFSKNSVSSTAAVITPEQRALIEDDVGQIACRTRSKRPLTSTSITEIENALVDPDITTDMYDNYFDYADYAQFHSSLYTATDDALIDDDADANDPYKITRSNAALQNTITENIGHCGASLHQQTNTQNTTYTHREDLTVTTLGPKSGMRRMERKKRTMKKKEMREIDELREELISLLEVEVLPYQNAASASEMIDSWNMQPGGQNMPSSFSPVKDTRGSHPVPSSSPVKATRVSLPLPTISPSFTYTSDSQPEPSSSSAPCSKFETQHPPQPPPPHLTHITSSTFEPIQPSHQPSTFVDSSKNSVSNTDTAAVVTPEQRALIKDNIRKHIQLLLQSYMLFQNASILVQVSTQAKSMIEELYYLRQRSCAGETSAFNVYNLDPAVELLSNPAVVENHRTGPVWTLSETHKLAILNSPAFIYPHLLPVLTQPKSEKKYKVFSRSEDNLIACGLEQFPKCKGVNPVELIHQQLIRGKTVEQVFYRVQYMSSGRVGDNPIKEVKKTGKLPASFPKPTIDHFYTVAPKDQLSDLLPAWVSDTLSACKVQQKNNTSLSQHAFIGHLLQQHVSGMSDLSTQTPYGRVNHIQQTASSTIQPLVNISAASLPVTFQAAPVVQLQTGLPPIAGIYIQFSQTTAAGLQNSPATTFPSLVTSTSAEHESTSRGLQNRKRTKREITLPSSTSRFKKQKVQASAVDEAAVSDTCNQGHQNISPDLLAKTMLSCGIEEYPTRPLPQTKFQYSQHIDQLGMSFISSTPIAQDKHPSTRNLSWEFDATHRQSCHHIPATQTLNTEETYSAQSKLSWTQVSACQTVVSQNETTATTRVISPFHHHESDVNGEARKEEARISKDSEENLIPYRNSTSVSNHDLLGDISKHTAASTGGDFNDSFGETSQGIFSSDLPLTSEMVECKKQSPTIVGDNNSQKYELSRENQKFSDLSPQSHLLMDITFQSQTENVDIVDSGLALDCTNQNDNGTCKTVQVDQSAQSGINLSVQNDKVSLNNVTEACEIAQDDRSAQSGNNLSVKHDKEELNNVTETNSTHTADVILPVLTDDSSSSIDKTLACASENISDSNNLNMSANSERQTQSKPKTIRQILKASKRCKPHTTISTSVFTSDDNCVTSDIVIQEITLPVVNDLQTNKDTVTVEPAVIETEGTVLSQEEDVDFESDDQSQQDDLQTNKDKVTVEPAVIETEDAGLSQEEEVDFESDDQSQQDDLQTNKDKVTVEPAVIETEDAVLSQEGEEEDFESDDQSQLDDLQTNKDKATVEPAVIETEGTVLSQEEDVDYESDDQSQKDGLQTNKDKVTVEPAGIETEGTVLSQEEDVDFESDDQSQQDDLQTNKDKATVEPAGIETEDAVLSQEEDVDFESDYQSQLDDLMAASTIIGCDPVKRSSGVDTDNKRKVQKKKDVCLSMLELDIIHRDSKKDERDTAYAQHYFTNITQMLSDDAERFKKFLTILHDVNRNHMNPVELYADMAHLLSRHQDLVDDFAGFLLSFQTVECNCFVSYLEYQQLLTFLMKLEIYCDSSNLTYQPTLKMMSRWLIMLNQEPQTDNTPFKENIAAVLRHVPNIMADLQSYFFGPPLPDSHRDDFEAVDLDEEAMADVDEFKEVKLGEEDIHQADVDEFKGVKLGEEDIHQADVDEFKGVKLGEEDIHQADVDEFKGVKLGEEDIHQADEDEFEEITLPEGREDYNTKLCSCQCHQDQQDEKLRRRIRHCYSCSLKIFDGKPVLKTSRNEYRPITILYPSEEKVEMIRAKKEAAQLALAKARAQRQWKKRNDKKNNFGSLKSKDSKNIPSKKKFKRRKRCKPQSNSADVGNIGMPVTETESKISNVQDDVSISTQKQDTSDLKSTCSKPSDDQYKTSSGKLTEVSAVVSGSPSTAKTSTDSENSGAQLSTTNGCGIVTISQTPAETAVIYVLENKLDSDPSFPKKVDIGKSDVTNVKRHFNADLFNSGLAPVSTSSNKSTTPLSDSHESRPSSVTTVASTVSLGHCLAGNDVQNNKQQPQMSTSQLNISQTQVLSKPAHPVSCTSSTLTLSQINRLDSPVASISQISADRLNVSRADSPLNRIVVSSQNTQVLPFGLQPRFATSPMVTFTRIPVLVTIAPQQYLSPANSVAGKPRQKTPQMSGVTTTVFSPQQIRSTKSDGKYGSRGTETNPSHNVIYSNPTCTQTLTSSSSSRNSSFPGSVITTDAYIVPQTGVCPASTVSDAIISSNSLISFAKLPSSFMHSGNQTVSVSVSSGEKLVPAADLQLSDTICSLPSTPVKDQIPAAVVRAHLDNFSLGAFDASMGFSQLQQLMQSPSKLTNSVTKFDLLALIDSSNLGSKDFTLQSCMASSSTGTVAEPLLTFSGALEKLRAKSDSVVLAAQDAVCESQSISVPVTMENLPATPDVTGPHDELDFEYAIDDDRQSYSIQETEEDLQNLCPQLNPSNMLLDDESSNSFVLSVWTEEQDRTILNVVIAEGVSTETVRKLHSKIPEKLVEEINSRARLLLQMLEQMGDTESDTDTDTSHFDSSEQVE